MAKNIFELTIQRGIRISSLCPLIMKHMRTNYRMLQYKRFSYNVFSDTLISGNVPKRGNKYAEVFETYFGWEISYPMKSKGDAHEDILLLLQLAGVPDQLIVDGSREQVLGSFKKKCS